MRGHSRNAIPAALNFSNGSRRTRVYSVFPEIFFLLATWTLTKLRPRVGAQPNFRLRETNDPGLVPAALHPSSATPLHERLLLYHFQPRLSTSALLLFHPRSGDPPSSLCPHTPSLSNPTTPAEVTYKLCFRVNFAGTAEFRNFDIQ